MNNLYHPRVILFSLLNRIGSIVINFGHFNLSNLISSVGIPLREPILSNLTVTTLFTRVPVFDVNQDIECCRNETHSVCLNGVKDMLRKNMNSTRRPTATVAVDEARYQPTTSTAFYNHGWDANKNIYSRKNRTEREYKRKVEREQRSQKQLEAELDLISRVVNLTKKLGRRPDVMDLAIGGFQKEEINVILTLADCIWAEEEDEEELVVA